MSYSDVMVMFGIFSIIILVVFLAIVNQINKLHDTLNSCTRDIEHIRYDMCDAEAGIGNINDRLDDITTSIDCIDNRLDEIGDDGK